VVLVDSKAALEEKGDTNPFSHDGVVLTTYNFAADNADAIKEVEWDLCVFEEAHRLRKVYSDTNKIAMALYEATKGRQKLLLTATPIHNSVMDIYGLVNFIDDNIFVDDEVFYKRYFNNPEYYGELAERIKNVCFRTLRQDVAKYAKLTNRIPKTIEFELSTKENELYDRLAAMDNAAEEYAEVKGIYDLCKSITKNAKGDAFMSALAQALAELKDKGANRKAVIFTENKTTQAYLYELLKAKYKNKVMQFNGSHSRDYDKIARFSKDIDILVATDIASEGFNFTHCSLVVNYDLPWNIQKIEQRIGRCHRTGQRHDVIVLNFLNKHNYADIRFMELVTKRLRLIKGVFNQGDDLMGDFEESVGKIMFNARTKDAIDKAFDALQQEHSSEIKKARQKTKDDIIRSFDDTLLSKIEFIGDEVKALSQQFNDTLWAITKYALGSLASFNEAERSLMIKGSYEGYYPRELIYKMDASERKGRRYGINNPLAKKVLDTCEFKRLYSGSVRVAGEKPLRALIGLYQVSLLIGYTYERYTRFIGVANDGRVMSHEECEALFNLPVTKYQDGYKDEDGVHEFVREEEQERLDKIFETHRDMLFAAMQQDHQSYLSDEIARLTAYNEDKKQKLDADIERLAKEINELTHKQNKATDFEERLILKRQIAELDKKKKQIEGALFFDKMQLDAILEEQVGALKSTVAQKATTRPEFYLNFEVETLGETI